MQVIIPRTITDADITSNVPFPDTGEVAWTAGTYNAGDERYVGTTIYRALTTTDDEPTAGELATPATWLDIGEVNRFKMFDGFNQTQTENADSIVVTFDYRALKTALALFFVEANTVNVTVTSVRGGGEVYNVTQSALDRSGVTNWWTFFKVRRGVKRSFFFDDLPAYTDSVVTVTIENTGSIAKCGNLVIGYPVDLGITLDKQFVPSTRDTSRYIEDKFERRTYLSYGSVREMEVTTKYLSAQHDAIYRYMEQLVSLPTAWIGEEGFSSSIVFGRGSAELIPSAHKWGDATYTIEGVQ